MHSSSGSSSSRSVSQPSTRDTAAVPQRLVIASRESALALWQARHVRDRLAALYPQTTIEILGLTTRGDQLRDASLAKLGGKGLFIKELEEALLDDRADLAVHSMKDVPMTLAPEFVLAAVMEREDARDAFVSNDHAGLDQLPAGAVVGTSSLRRASQICARYPRLVIEPLRGNVQTRLRKLDEGRYAAIVLAAAGLKRLGLEDRITMLLAPEQSLPAPGQGALAIECRANREALAALLTALNHPQTASCVAAERAMSQALSGSCVVPLGAFAELDADRLRLRGFVASPDGTRMIAGEVGGAVTDPEALGRELAAELNAQGAGEILAALESTDGR
ncbi:MAG TPA: hydroxymethylbilane synthase [Burkholderiales bacterium]|nr:hydroxymethylbilane synthase [Burkholderiales bacterium]